MKRGKLVLWIALAVVVAFLAGYIPGYVRNRSLEAQTAEMRVERRLCGLRDRLGSVFVETSLKNYGTALEGLNGFFTEAQAAANATESPAVRQALEGLLRRRDDVTAKMARADVQVYGDIQDMYRVLLQQTANLAQPAPR